MPPQIEDLIAAEIKGLPEQNWARIWKTAGLSHLKAGRAGRPKSSTKIGDKKNLKSASI
jgi:hypothetical protein